MEAPDPVAPDADGLLARVEALFAHDLAGFLPLLIGGETFGWVKPAFAERLVRHRDVFRATDGGISLHPGLRGAEERTAAVADVTRALQRAGLLPEQKPEPYPVVRSFGEEPALLVDRVIVAHLGVKAFGVHLNAYVATPRGLHLWVARRATTRRQSPGKLDHLVAGGQPAGLSLADNLVKECAEEADLPEPLARSALPVGTLSYRREVPHGLRNDTLFLYDLAVPGDFAPRNRDGEVESFALWPATRVLASLRETDDWKYNVGPVVLDFLVRHGVVPPADPAYRRLHRARPEA